MNQSNDSGLNLDRLEAPNGGMHDSIFVKVWGDAGGGDAGRRALAQYAFDLGRRAAPVSAPIAGDALASALRVIADRARRDPMEDAELEEYCNDALSRAALANQPAPTAAPVQDNG